MKIGLGIGIPFIRNYISSIFDPSKLFTGNTQGVWYDPSDINLTWRRNLLTYSEQFDNAVWPKNEATVIANAALAPDGTLTADLLVPSINSSSAHRIFLNTGISIGSKSVSSVYLKAGGYRYCAIIFNDTSNAVAVDLQTGTITYNPTSIDSAVITSVGDDWYRLSVSNKTPGFHQWFGVYAFNTQVISSSWPTYTGDGTSGIYIWGAQLEVGSTATPYQRITDGVQDYYTYQAQPVLFQDAAGATPVTAVEQPVGLMLDKSKGLVLGPELVDTANTVGAWTPYGSNTVTSDDGAIKITYVGGPGSGFGAYSILSAAGCLSQDLVASKCYEISFTARVSSGNSVDFGVRNGSISFSSVATVTATTYTAYKVRFFTNASYTSSPNFTLNNSFGAGEAIWIKDISVRELPGNHAFQSTSANRPTLSARYNLLTKSEDFSDAVWNKTGCSATANLITENSSAGLKIAVQNLTFAASTHSLICDAKPNGRQWIVFQQSEKYAYFNLSGQGSVGTTSGILSASISLQPDGYYTCTVNATATAGENNVTVYLASANGVVNYVGDGVSGIYVRKIDLRVANDALNMPAYQRVNTSTDYDTVGFKPYLSFNGTSSSMQTNSIDFTYTDKMFVSAGVRKLSDAAFGMIAELSNNISNNNGSFSLSAGNLSTGAPAYAGATKGTSFGSAQTSNNYPAPITNTLTTDGDISGDSFVIRVNGTQAAISTADQGTGNYGNYPLYLGARAGTSLFANIRFYGLVAAGKQVSAAEITSTETYLNQRTGAF